VLSKCVDSREHEVARARRDVGQQAHVGAERDAARGVRALGQLQALRHRRVRTLAEGRDERRFARRQRVRGWESSVSFIGVWASCIAVCSRAGRVA